MKRATLTGALLLWAWPAFSQIAVTAGTYGSNVAGVPRGNATAQLAAACNGAMTCSYIVNYWTWGDPAPNKAKAFTAEWSCTGDPAPHSVTAAAEAGYGSVVSLACSAPAPTPGPAPSGTPAPTYNTVTFSCAPPMAPCNPLVLRLVQGSGKLNVNLAPQ